MSTRIRTVIQSFICASVATVLTAALAWSVIDSTTSGSQYEEPSQHFTQG